MFEVRSCRWCEVAADGFLNLTAFLLCKSAFYETHTCLCVLLCVTVSVFCARFGLIFATSMKNKVINVVNLKAFNV